MISIKQKKTSTFRLIKVSLVHIYNRIIVYNHNPYRIQLNYNYNSKIRYLNTFNINLILTTQMATP